jgi:hypothetical protein
LKTYPLIDLHRVPTNSNSSFELRTSNSNTDLGSFEKFEKFDIFYCYFIDYYGLAVVE